MSKKFEGITELEYLLVVRYYHMGWFSKNRVSLWQLLPFAGFEEELGCILYFPSKGTGRVKRQKEKKKKTQSLFNGGKKVKY